MVPAPPSQKNEARIRVRVRSSPPRTGKNWDAYREWGETGPSIPLLIVTPSVGAPGVGEDGHHATEGMAQQTARDLTDPAGPLGGKAPRMLPVSNNGDAKLCPQLLETTARDRADGRRPKPPRALRADHCDSCHRNPDPATPEGRDAIRRAHGAAQRILRERLPFTDREARQVYLEDEACVGPVRREIVVAEPDVYRPIHTTPYMLRDREVRQKLFKGRHVIFDEVHNLAQYYIVTEVALKRNLTLPEPWNRAHLMRDVAPHHRDDVVHLLERIGSILRREIAGAIVSYETLSVMKKINETMTLHPIREARAIEASRIGRIAPSKATVPGALSADVPPAVGNAIRLHSMLAEEGVVLVDEARDNQAGLNELVETMPRALDVLAEAIWRWERSEEGRPSPWLAIVEMLSHMRDGRYLLTKATADQEGAVSATLVLADAERFAGAPGLSMEIRPRFDILRDAVAFADEITVISGTPPPRAVLEQVFGPGAEIVYEPWSGDVPFSILAELNTRGFDRLWQKDDGPNKPDDFVQKALPIILEQRPLVFARKGPEREEFLRWFGPGTETDYSPGLVHVGRGVMSQGVSVDAPFTFLLGPHIPPITDHEDFFWTPPHPRGLADDDVRFSEIDAWRIAASTAEAGAQAAPRTSSPTSPGKAILAGCGAVRWEEFCGQDWPWLRRMRGDTLRSEGGQSVAGKALTMVDWIWDVWPKWGTAEAEKLRHAESWWQNGRPAFDARLAMERARLWASLQDGAFKLPTFRGGCIPMSGNIRRPVLDALVDCGSLEVLPREESKVRAYRFNHAGDMAFFGRPPSRHLPQED